MASLQKLVLILHQSFRITFLVLLFALPVTLGKNNISVSKSLNAFGRYGYYSISMRTVPRAEQDPWIFREPVIDVFQSNPQIVMSNEINKASSDFEFHMEFCEDLDQLLQAYFRDYTIELMEKPWNGFTAGWNPGTTARYLGIEANYLENMSYILVRILKRKEFKQLNEPLTCQNVEPLPHVKALADAVQVGNKSSVDIFFKKFGTHYISSYSTGNALYQVFAYHPSSFRRAKRVLNSGLSTLKKSQIQTYFSPWYAEHVGVVLSASRNMTLMNWAATTLATRTHMYPYANLMKLYGSVKLFKELDMLLSNEALLSIDLRALTPIFKDSKKRDWFLEMLSNGINLWEVSM